MKTHIFLALTLGLLWAPALAEPAQEPTLPWAEADAALNAVASDFQSAGFPGVASHVAEMERVLVSPTLTYAAPSGGPLYVLTDGAMEDITAMSVYSEAVKKDPALKGRKIVAIGNPYPGISLLLGSYYNEIGRFDDAFRVLDKGMTMSVLVDLKFGNHLPLLASERALSLARLGRLPDALAAYDEGLKLAAIDDKGKARMHRGRGYVLTEMERLDEAEAAYRESLKFEPDNKIAKGELDYILRLRLGGAKAPSGIIAPGAAPKTP